MGLSSQALSPVSGGKHKPGPGPPQYSTQPTTQEPTHQPGPSRCRTELPATPHSTHLLGFSLTAGGLPGGGGAVKSSSMSLRVTFFWRSHSASWRVILFSKPTRSNIERSVSWAERENEELHEAVDKAFDEESGEAHKQKTRPAVC